jgi:hypothetical protein
MSVWHLVLCGIAVLLTFVVGFIVGFEASELRMVE